MTPEEMETAFPNLRNSQYAITSPPTPNYNCIAWAVGDTEHWWEPIRHIPGYYWPRRAPLAYTLDSYTAALELHGFSVCDDAEPEPGFEKIALYANADGEPTHAARQLASGQWTSKLGDEDDITHDTANALEGDDYGALARFLKRRTGTSGFLPNDSE